MHIQLLRSYRGHLTNEQLIQPGTYDDNDPLLMGLADYLIQNGHATIIDDGLPLVVSEPEVDAESSAGFLTHKEILALRGQSAVVDETLAESEPEVAAPKRQSRRK